MDASPTCIDLFCGCGGFTLGVEQAGFRTLAAIEVDPYAVNVFQANFGCRQKPQHQVVIGTRTDLLAGFAPRLSARRTPGDNAYDVEYSPSGF